MPGIPRCSPLNKSSTPIPPSIEEYQDSTLQFLKDASPSRNRTDPSPSIVNLFSVWFPVKQHEFTWVFDEHFLSSKMDVHDQ